MKAHIVTKLVGEYGRREWECACSECGYILKVITEKCPKCGAEFEKKGCKYGN